MKYPRKKNELILTCAIWSLCSLVLLHKFKDSSYIKRRLQSDGVTGDFIVEWTLSLGGQESLLESPFLKAGLEQSVKDYINNDIKCNSQSSSGSPSFHSVEIQDFDERKFLQTRRIEGNGKCKGDPTKCKKGIAESLGGDGVTEDDFFKEAKGKEMNSISTTPDFCELFQGTTIFDLFKKVLVTASSFNYNVDVQDIYDLEGSLTLDYDVTFQPAQGDGLDKVDSVELEAKEPKPIVTSCSESQCITQKSVMTSIMSYFEIPFDGSKHECLLDGVNCNSDDLVTHIWINNRSLNDKTIPESLSFLPSLQGLFLGGNGLIGTIPSQLGSLRKLRLLWLQDNALTGPIPHQLANIRGLLQINIYNNKLTGTLPTKLGKLQHLQLLNLGRNMFHGTIPEFVEVLVESTQIVNCENFPSPFKKFELNWLKQEIPEGSEVFFNLKTLSLHENNFNGTFPVGFSRFINLVDLSLASNKLTGRIPSELETLKKLAILDLHDNQLSGSIPWQIESLQALTVLNLYNNRLKKTIPTNIGKLTKLTELVLDNNALTGPIPSHFGNLINLKYLTFSGNDMSGEIPSELGNLESLHNLDLRGYMVRASPGSKSAIGTLPSELGRLKQWKYVVFENNGLKGTVPTEFGNLKSSETLWLKNQELTGNIPAELSGLESLGVLSLGNNSLTGSIKTELGGLGKLSTFDIGSNGLAGGIPKEMAKLSKLKYMGIDNLNISGNLPKELQDLSLLEYLSLENNDVTGGIPTELGRLRSLKALNLNNNIFTGAIPSEMGNLPEVKHLSVGSNNISGEVPSELSVMQELISLHIGGNVLTKTIPTELGLLTSLSHLNLGHNEFTGPIPSELGHLKNLVSLNYGANALTGTIPTELSSLPNLLFMFYGGNNIIDKPRFLCDLRSLNLEDSIDLHCPNYCGTPLEECNSNNLGGAICSDVGCGGSGVPTCTEFCRLDYSSCPTGPNEMSIQLNLHTDDKAWETTWEVKNSNGVIVLSGDSYKNFDSTVEFNCMKKDCYIFELKSHREYDVCWDQDYSLKVDGLPAAIRPSKEYEIGSCTGASFPSLVSLSPTPHSLVCHPSNKPSFQPNMLTSLSPSLQPDIHSLSPSSEPITPPTQHPTKYPTSSPSQNLPPKLTSPDISRSDQFGFSVAISESIIVVGSPSSNGMTSFSGSAYLFATSGLLLKKLVAPDSILGAQFGYSVAATESDIIVGAPSDIVLSGSVYFFSASGDYKLKRRAPDNVPGDKFGSSVSVSGTTVVVGCPLDDDNGIDSGSVYVYNTAGFFLRKISADLDLASSDQFGFSVAISGFIIVVGSPFGSGGSVYLFATSGLLLKKLVAPDSIVGAQFGYSVAATESDIIVGAPSDMNLSGSVYFFSASGDYKFKVFWLSADAFGTRFGSSVSVSGTTVVVGCPLDDANGVDSGSVYVYNTAGSYVRKINPFDGAVQYSQFGFSVAVSGSVILIGAPFDNGGSTYTIRNL